jgi:predicted flap endonuclease-1-like 5' DNA nuclease
MFKNWGFLLGEIWVLLALAALIGLLAGWLIWGRRDAVIAPATTDPEAERLRRDLAECQRQGQAHLARLGALEAQLKAADARADRLAAGSGLVGTVAEVVSDTAGAVQDMASGAVESVLDMFSGSVAPAKPQGLNAAREGGPDDLKLIKGIGPKLEKLCNSLGYFHFDQIAGWTPAEIAWVDENLEGFKGRVTRDEWVVQARDLAAGKPPRAMAAKPEGL